jgi:cephalosporin-C deacetylase-like acetyl esterase
MVSTQILKREAWDAMEELEETLAELPGVDEERIAAVGKRAGNSSYGHPPRPRADDQIGTARYLTDLRRVVVEVLAEQERRISRLEGRN